MLWYNAAKVWSGKSFSLANRPSEEAHSVLEWKVFRFNGSSLQYFPRNCQYSHSWMFFQVGKHFISISLFFFVWVLCPTLMSSRNIYRKECDQIFLQGNENSFNLPGCDVSICGAYLGCSVVLGTRPGRFKTYYRVKNSGKVLDMLQSRMENTSQASCTLKDWAIPLEFSTGFWTL